MSHRFRLGYVWAEVQLFKLNTNMSASFEVALRLCRVRLWRLLAERLFPGQQLFSCHAFSSLFYMRTKFEAVRTSHTRTRHLSEPGSAGRFDGFCPEVSESWRGRLDFSVRTALSVKELPEMLVSSRTTEKKRQEIKWNLFGSVRLRNSRMFMTKRESVLRIFITSMFLSDFIKMCWTEPKTCCGI